MIAASRYPAFSRNFADEQDYADAAVSAARRASPLVGNLTPILRWKKRQQRHGGQPQSLPNKTNKKKFKTLVVGFEGGGASFAQRCFGLSEANWIGTLILPGATSSAADAQATTRTMTTTTRGGLGDSLDPADPFNSACNIFRKKAEGSIDGGEGDSDDDGDVAVALCGYRVPAAQAHAWAEALLCGIEAEVVVVLTTVGVQPGRSEVWEGARLVATAEAEEREDCLEMSRGFQPLRTPTMLSGSSAALVAYCQRHGRAAMCFATAELPRGLMRRGDGSEAERSLFCTRKPLGVLAGDAMVTLAAASGGSDAVNDIMDSTSSLYV